MDPRATSQRPRESRRRASPTSSADSNVSAKRRRLRTKAVATVDDGQHAEEEDGHGERGQVGGAQRRLRGPHPLHQGRRPLRGGQVGHQHEREQQPGGQGHEQRQQEDAERRREQQDGEAQGSPQPEEGIPAHVAPEPALVVEPVPPAGRRKRGGDRPRAGSDHEVHLDPALVERLHHPRVIGAGGPAAGEDEGRPALRRVLLHRMSDSSAMREWPGTGARRAVRRVLAGPPDRGCHPDRRAHGHRHRGGVVGVPQRHQHARPARGMQPHDQPGPVVTRPRRRVPAQTVQRVLEVGLRSTHRAVFEHRPVPDRVQVEAFRSPFDDHGAAPLLGAHPSRDRRVWADAPRARSGTAPPAWPAAR